MLKALITSLFSLGTISLGAAQAQTIVQTGDNLQAVINAASSGDVIEIHSDATFTGNFTWAGKELTIVASPGSSPTLKSNPGHYALRLLSSNPPAKGVFKGITFESGSPLSSSLAPGILLGLTDLPQGGAELILKNCNVLGTLNVSAQGNTAVKCELFNTATSHHTDFFGSTGIPLEVLISDCQISGYLRGIAISGALPKTLNMEVRRTRFTHKVRFQTEALHNLNVSMESCIVDQDPAGIFTYGIQNTGPVNGTFTNNTVTGFPVGILGVATTAWHNMLLIDNGQSLQNVTAAEIQSSVIGDGTHAGLNGNLAGPALLDGNHWLYKCSVGVDAGSNSAPGLGPADINGNPRIMDSNGDFVSQVSVGAIETAVNIPGSISITNGNGINPQHFGASFPPAIGKTFQTFAAPDNPTFATLVIIELPGPPTTVPGWTGELLLSSPTTGIMDFGLGPHNFPIPCDTAYIGISARAQAFRFDFFFGVTSYHCLNALDFVVGA